MPLGIFLVFNCSWIVTGIVLVLSLEFFLNCHWNCSWTVNGIVLGLSLEFSWTVIGIVLGLSLELVLDCH